MTDLSIVVVSWNTRELSLACVAATLREVRACASRRTCEIVLVDNGSSDATADAVRERFPSVRVVRLPRNLGFAAGANRGLARARGFQYSVDIWMKMAEKAAIDYSFHMNLTQFNEKIAKGIPSLMKMGIQTLKVFTAYNGRLRVDDGSIFKALQIARDNGMLVMAHCENGDVIDTLIEQAPLRLDMSHPSGTR